MVETRLWICPAQCGCEIAMTADWSEPASIDDRGRAVSYRHPTPFTATGLSIVGVCAGHDALRTAGVNPDPWPDRPGYLRRPIPKATEAESLYVQLWGVHAQTVALDTCGCIVHQVVDELAGTVVTSAHPKLTRKCRDHVADDEQHTAAIGENLKRNELVTRLLAEPSLTQADPADPGAVMFVKGREPKVYYDGQRTLRVDFGRAAAGQRGALAATVAAIDPAVVVD